MGTSSRDSDPISASLTILALTSIVMRLFFRSSSFLGVAGATVAFWLAIVACLIRFIDCCWDALNQRTPWSQLALPIFIGGHIAVAGLGGNLRNFTALLLATGEFTLLVAVGRNWLLGRKERSAESYPEQFMGSVLGKYLPVQLARMFAVEAVILSSALYGLARFCRLPDVSGFSYVERSTYKFLPLILILISPPEIALFHALFGNSWGLGFGLLHLWAVLWAYGLYVTMRMRPHTIESDRLCLHRGILSAAYIPISSIKEISETYRSDGAFLKIRGPWHANIALKGTPLIDLTLSAPIEVVSVFGRKAQGIYLISFSIDDSEVFQGQLRLVMPSLVEEPISSKP